MTSGQDARLGSREWAAHLPPWDPPPSAYCISVDSSHCHTLTNKHTIADLAFASDLLKHMCPCSSHEQLGNSAVPSTTLNSKMAF